MKEIEGYEGRYSITKEGEVYSHIRNRNLVPYKDSNGYFMIGLRKDGNRKMYKLHRIIAEHFIPNLDNKPQVNHKNGIKVDNNLDNLEWVTNAENVQHAFDNGLAVGLKGEKNPSSILTEADVKEIRDLIKEGMKLKEIASSYNISRRSINNIKLNRTWKDV